MKIYKIDSSNVSRFSSMISPKLPYMRLDFPFNCLYYLKDTSKLMNDFIALFIQERSEEYELDRSFSAIAPNRFSCDSFLKKVNLSQCATIGTEAFYSCSNLSFVNIPVCSEIWTSAFCYCNSLSFLNAPSCQHVGINAFAYCSALSQINLPNCHIIESGAFAFCENLQNVDARQCNTVYQTAFQNCTNIECVSFGCIYELQDFTFQSCSKLKSVYFFGTISTSLQSNAFAGTPIADSTYLGYYGSIYVRSYLLETYMSDPIWMSVSSRLVAI